jgi:hypothetical protein
MRELEINGKLFGLPTNEDFVAASVELGISVPNSYALFCRTYGRGEVDNLVYIFVPTQTVPDHIGNMTEGLAATIRDDVEADLAVYFPHGSEDLARRLVPFGSTSNGHILAWDPEDDVDTEHAIYVVAEGSLSFVKAGYGLDQFLDSIFSDDVKRVLGPGYEPRRPVFRPLPI